MKSSQHRVAAALYVYRFSFIYSTILVRNFGAFVCHYSSLDTWVLVGSTLKTFEVVQEIWDWLI